MESKWIEAEKQFRLGLTYSEEPDMFTYSLIDVHGTKASRNGVPPSWVLLFYSHPPSQSCRWLLFWLRGLQSSFSINTTGTVVRVRIHCS
ncbi:hypothetical protein TNCV_2451171 [Trichonephila clavipes]|nr:hypothetical protein TNCV_2451171 [Trichonephila clavipes]